MADTANRRILLHQLRRFADHLIASAADPNAPTLSTERPSETLLTLLDRSLALDDLDTYVRLLARFGESLFYGDSINVLDRHLVRVLAQPALLNAQRVSLTSLRILLLIQVSKPDEAFAALEAGWDAADTPLLQAEMIKCQGLLLTIFKRDFIEGKAAYDRALELAMRAEDDQLIAAIRNNLGDWAYLQERYADALDLYHAALEASYSVADRSYQASAEAGIAVSLTDLEQYEEAKVFHQRARAHFKEAGERRGIVRTNLNESYLATLMGDGEEGKLRADEALRLARELGDAQRVAFAKHNLGHACLVAREYEAASIHLQEALAQRLLLNKRIYIEKTLEILDQLRQAVEQDDTLEPVTRATILQACQEALGAVPA